MLASKNHDLSKSFVLRAVVRAGRPMNQQKGRL
jgi:hypothetical protein